MCSTQFYLSIDPSSLLDIVFVLGLRNSNALWNYRSELLQNGYIGSNGIWWAHNPIEPFLFSSSARAFIQFFSLPSLLLQFIIYCNILWVVCMLLHKSYVMQGDLQNRQIFWHQPLSYLILNQKMSTYCGPLSSKNPSMVAAHPMPQCVTPHLSGRVDSG